MSSIQVFEKLTHFSIHLSTSTLTKNEAKAAKKIANCCKELGVIEAQQAIDIFKRSGKSLPNRSLVKKLKSSAIESEAKNCFTSFGEINQIIKESSEESEKSTKKPNFFNEKIKNIQKIGSMISKSVTMSEANLFSSLNPPQERKLWIFDHRIEEFNEKYLETVLNCFSDERKKAEVEKIFQTKITPTEIQHIEIHFHSLSSFIKNNNLNEGNFIGIIDQAFQNYPVHFKIPIVEDLITKIKEKKSLGTETTAQEKENELSLILQNIIICFAAYPLNIRDMWNKFKVDTLKIEAENNEQINK
jgi:hypothetical protein